MSEERKEVIDKLNELAPFISFDYIMAIHKAIDMLSVDDRPDSEKIKEALYVHGDRDSTCNDCPYHYENACIPKMVRDALTYIEYLEGQKGE